MITRKIFFGIYEPNKFKIPSISAKKQKLNIFLKKTIDETVENLFNALRCLDSSVGRAED
ncbi:hypothetical protein C9J47_26755 [Photobacterium indicum]|uniref:Uncharacterized protein n=1 Tax=Photobacterium indicum TaxID=81447 RepID=A0A2T3L0Z1_9GAMM|nr:hypothetical protein C9J47_26755 [Photobacterium indicum]